MIRWGVLGAASIARRRVIPAIQASSNGRVTAVASRDPARAQALADELGLPNVHADYQSLLADPEIDAIYNPLPNSEHLRWTIAALNAGKPVLCEKPFALTADDAQRMVEAARQGGVLLAEAFMYRFHPRVVKLLALIQAMTIGEVRIVRSTFTFGPLATGNIRLDPTLGGGVLMDVGCYCVNLARLVYGREPEGVKALAHNGDTNVDETFAGILDFGGAIATFDVSFGGQGGSNYEIIGSAGKLVAPLGFRPETNQPTELHVYRNWEQETIMIEPADQYRLMAEDFADAIITQRPVRYGPDDGVANMRVLEALRADAQLTSRQPSAISYQATSPKLIADG